MKPIPTARPAPRGNGAFGGPNGTVSRSKIKTPECLTPSSSIKQEENLQSDGADNAEAFNDDFWGSLLQFDNDLQEKVSIQASQGLEYPRTAWSGVSSEPAMNVQDSLSGGAASFPSTPEIKNVEAFSRSLRKASGRLYASTQTSFSEKQHLSPPLAFQLLRNPDLGDAAWSGDLSENWLPSDAIRQGRPGKRYLEHAHEEIGTGKQCLLSRLKSAACTKGFSTFVSSSCKGRQHQATALAQLASNVSTGITMTERKRASWLDTLSDPATPLSKQSRAIPRGLRGRTLLDHCLKKKLPLARAVWLIKSVGGDELQSVRRSSLEHDYASHAEAQWLRSWTELVESFVDIHNPAVDAQADSEDLLYTSKLTQRLFTEGLLDDDHFLQSIIRKFEECESSQLTFSLSRTQQYRPALVREPSHAHHLAEASALKLRSLYESSEGPEHPSYKALEKSVQDLACTIPAQFVISNIWKDVEECLSHACHNAPSTQIANRLAHIIEFNRSTARWVAGPAVADLPFPQVMKELDSALPCLSFDTLSTKLLATLPDRKELIFCLISWATTLHGTGTHRIYLGCRLAREWHRYGIVNAHDTILHALLRLRRSRTASPDAVARFCAEMMRSNTFRAADYIRALSTTETADPTDMDRHVLAQMSTHELSSDVLSLRTGILDAHPPGEWHVQDLLEIKQIIASQMKAALSDQASDVPLVDLAALLRNITVSQRFELSKWLHPSLMTFLSKRPDNASQSLPPRLVKLVVAVLEELDDYLSLYAVLPSLAAKSDQDGLLLIAMSAEGQDKTHAILNFLGKIWQALFSRYRSLRSNNPPHKPLCCFFHRTSYWHKTSSSVDQYLTHEIELCDGVETLAACTPLSDVQDEESDDGRSDIDRLLANGPSLDHPRLTAAIALMLSHVCVFKDVNDSRNEAVKSNLTALRNANEAIFGHLLKACVQARLGHLQSDMALNLIAMLLSSASMSIPDVLHCAEVRPGPNDGSTRGGSSPIAALHLLTFFFGTPNAISGDPKMFLQRRLWAQQAAHSEAETLVPLVTSVLTTSRQEDHHAGLLLLFASADFQVLMRSLFHESLDVLLTSLDMARTDGSGATLGNWWTLITTMLGPTILPGEQDAADESARNLREKGASFVGSLLESVDEISLSVFQFAMRLAALDCTTESAISSMAKTITATATTVAQRPLLWTRVLSKTTTDLARAVRAHAQQLLLFCPTSSAAFEEAFQTPWPSPPMVCANLIEGCRSSISTDGELSTGQLIAKHLNSAMRTINEDVLKDTTGVLEWLEALIAISLVHFKAFANPSDMALLLYSLCRLVQMPCLQPHTIMTDAYRAACFFAPRASAQVVGKIKQALGPYHTDPRLRALLGTSSSIEQPLAARGFFTSSTGLGALAKWERFAETNLSTDSMPQT